MWLLYEMCGRHWRDGLVDKSWRQDSHSSPVRYDLQLTPEEQQKCAVGGLAVSCPCPFGFHAYDMENFQG